MKKNEFLNRAINNLCDPQAVAYPVNLMHVETPTESYAATISAGFGLFADIGMHIILKHNSFENSVTTLLIVHIKSRVVFVF